MRIEHALFSAGQSEVTDPVAAVLRQSYLTTLATVAVGGPAGEPVTDLAECLGQPQRGHVLVPQRAGAAEIVPLEHAAGFVRGLDLRFGGGLAAPLAGQLLTYALALRPATISEPMRVRLHTTTGALAMQAAWSNADNGHHDHARHLFTLAVQAAVEADEADLRAHVLAEAAAHHSQLGNHTDAATILRLADGDERTSPAVRCLIAGVRARLHAASGERQACLRAVEQVDAYAEQVCSGTVPAWMGWEPAHVDALAGHALATLATACGDASDYTDAHKRLLTAVDGLAHTERTRAKILCQLQLAHLHHHNSDTEQAAAWAATSTVGRDRPPQPFAREPALDLRGDAADERTRDLTPFD